MEPGTKTLIRPCTRVYLALVALTLVTFLVGEMGLGGLNIALGVLLLAMLKGHLVGAYFMGLGRLRGIWRWPVSVWLILPGALISIAFILST